MARQQAQEILLGQEPPPDASRDAVHVAVIPMTAPCDLVPGQRLAAGIVDPFLTSPVKKGQRFWMAAYPGTVVGLRHTYALPTYPDDPRPPVPMTKAELAAALEAGTLPTVPVKIVEDPA